MVNQHIKRRAIHRARILEGQTKGLTKAIEREEYCINLLHHSLSIQKSLKSLDQLLLENHLKTHVIAQMKKNAEGRAIKELLTIFSLSNQ